MNRPQAMKIKKESEALLDGAEIVSRMQEAYSVSSLAALAAAMGEKEPTVKNWRQRGAVRLQHVLKAAMDTKRSVDWLVRGDLGPDDITLIECKGSSAAVSVHVSEPPATEWLSMPAPSPVRSDTFAGESPHSGGGAGINLGGSGALLGEMGASNHRPLVLSLVVEKAGRHVDYEVIPKVLGGAHAGAGGRGGETLTQPLKLDRAGDMAFGFEWLNRHLHHTTGKLATVQVAGDSMATTLLDGETVIVDLGATEVTVDAIYVIEIQGRRLVKRVQRRVDGSLVLISDNKAYARETVQRGQVGEIQVIGRMVWPQTR